MHEDCAAQAQINVSEAPQTPIRLPPELILEILEDVLAEPHNITDLALVSKAIASLLYRLLYSTVLLPSPERIRSFAEDVISTAPGLICQHVKRVIFTWEGQPSKETLDFARDILLACTEAHTLALPGCLVPSLLADDNPQCLPTTLTHLTLGSFSMSNIPPNHARPSFSNLTHLRIADPFGLFTTPRAMFKHLGSLPNLTHLYVPHVIMRWPDTDDDFVDDVVALLHERDKLHCLIVGLCLPRIQQPSEEYDRDRDYELEERVRQASTAWTRVKQLQEAEERLLIIRADVTGAWLREWKNAGSIKKPFDFWRETISEGLSERKREGSCQSQSGEKGRDLWP
ncbi:hypothetical protein HETIRDRAFT_108444 [Heterobasidion irregulare TC 32-1]|uniref:F-box domain-containing protein n=1 Tax=Heterobasidion irregulare (strain TC 32-1) TaxID=747525 RepID=W4JMU7_HETIT|nr:uncharacterized protein HETIRDRAFT_108444 [Heterobasidion irregulare TC 32-1]ETW74853.1 hypothetical protein HETIRDRAFT_108444 [Heterobasidion irregulare TC 32-1]